MKLTSRGATAAATPARRRSRTSSVRTDTAYRPASTPTIPTLHPHQTTVDGPAGSQAAAAVAHLCCRVATAYRRPSTPQYPYPPPSPPATNPHGTTATFAELVDGELPEPVTSLVDGLKTVVTYSRRDDGKVERKTRVFSVETRKAVVSKAVMLRRNWSKFGVAKSNPPGPDTASTNTVSDDIYLQLSSKKKLEVRCRGLCLDFQPKFPRARRFPLCSPASSASSPHWPASSASTSRVITGDGVSAWRNKRGRMGRCWRMPSFELESGSRGATFLPHGVSDDAAHRSPRHGRRISSSGDHRSPRMGGGYPLPVIGVCHVLIRSLHHVVFE